MRQPPGEPARPPAEDGPAPPAMWSNQRHHACHESARYSGSGLPFVSGASQITPNPTMYTSDTAAPILP